MRMTGTLATMATTAALVACGASVETPAGDAPGGAGGDGGLPGATGSGGAGASIGSGGDGATGAIGGTGGFGASSGCGDCEDVASISCFCATDEGWHMCDGSFPSIEQVLEPSCPGPLLYPISDSCKIGGLYFPFDDFDYDVQAYLFDRDTEDLVGLFYETDVQVCGESSEWIKWGIGKGSCDLCDPCGEGRGYPACAE